ncbi:MAG: prepilin-type N-terminal cleavage/methylation domain-containing protein [Candidatus Hydrogenedentes bacterium]|nr:prepilin-type N-terminal cleavage/methylation domain-containing protein [Candidatus Hydrogenedentota bacterium]
MRRHGFTLLEVLIAISILMIIVIVLYTSFSSVINTMDAARVSAEEARLRLFLERSFRANLTATYTDRSMEEDVFRFVGVDDETRDGPNDSLRFVSVNTLMGGSGLPGDLKEVRYGTIGGPESEFDPIEFEDDEGNPLDKQRKLESVETPLFGANVQELDPDTGFVKPAEGEDSGVTFAEEQYQAPSWSVPIRTVDFSYFDGTEWVEEWDSQLTGRIPWCVRVRINFARTEEQLEEEEDLGLSIIDNPEFEVVVPLPAGMGSTQDARALSEMEAMQDEATENEVEPGDPRDPNEQSDDNVQVIGDPSGMSRGRRR